MQIWDNIIQTAMLGTDKKQLAATSVTEDLSDIFTAISSNPANDKEAQFLQMTAAVFNYRQSGAKPLQDETVTIEKAAAETLPYCSTKAQQLLSQIFDEDSNSLLKIWLELCAAKQHIVPPVLLPVLLGKALASKAIRSRAISCGGNRALWLKQFNKAWDFSAPVTADTEDLWDSGTTEQRCRVLIQKRNTEPAIALEWLQQTWPKENANTKAELLKNLAENLSQTDLPWLETLTADKSQKVKDVARDLLKSLPGSSVVTLYQQVLQQAIVLNKADKNIEIRLPENVDETIFKTGIEKLSSQKRFTDERYIIYQLLSFTPLSFMEQHLDADPKTIIGYFQKDDANKKFLEAFAESVMQFKDHRWALALMENSDAVYTAIIPFLPAEKQEPYCISCFASNEEMIIEFANKQTTEWSMELAENIFSYIVKNPYYYNRGYYNRQIANIPQGIAGKLETYKPKEQYYQSTWENQIEYIKKLLAIKAQTTTAFS